MTDDIVEVMETVHDGKSYVIAQSLKEQKRANDLSERWQWVIVCIWASIVLMIIAAVIWLHINNIPTRILG